MKTDLVPTADVERKEDKKEGGGGFSYILHNWSYKGFIVSYTTAQMFHAGNGE